MEIGRWAPDATMKQQDFIPSCTCEYKRDASNMPTEEDDAPTYLPDIRQRRRTPWLRRISSRAA